MKKNNLIMLLGASVLVIVLTITVSLTRQQKAYRGYAASSPTQTVLPMQAGGNSTGSNQPPLTVTLPPEQLRYKAPNDTIPPRLSLTSPQNGTTVQQGDTLTMTATASDDYTVAKVVFLINGITQCTVTAAPYSCTWTVPNHTATYLIVTRAFDQTGNLTSKSAVVQSR